MPLAFQIRRPEVPEMPRDPKSRLFTNEKKSSTSQEAQKGQGPPPKKCSVLVLRNGLLFARTKPPLKMLLRVTFHVSRTK